MAKKRDRKSKKPSTDASGGEDPQAQAIFLAVGRAISTWSFVEQALFEVYSLITHPGAMPIGGPASFFAIDDFAKKVSVVSRLIEISYDRQTHPNLHRDWKSLSSKLLKHSVKYDRLTHGACVHFDKDGQNVDFDYGWVPFFTKYNLIYALNFAGDRDDPEVCPILSSRRIDKHRHRFRSLEGDLEKFIAEHGDALVQPVALGNPSSQAGD